MKKIIMILFFLCCSSYVYAFDYMFTDIHVGFRTTHQLELFLKHVKAKNTVGVRGEITADQIFISGTRFSIDEIVKSYPNIKLLKCIVENKTGMWYLISFNDYRELREEEK